MTEDKAPYAVPTETPPAKKRRGPKPGSKRKPRSVVTPSATTPPVAVVYRGEGIEVIGVYLDPGQALRALAETEGARVELA
jgi:hypothetical protein